VTETPTQQAADPHRAPRQRHRVWRWLRHWRWRISAALVVLCLALGLWGYSLRWPNISFGDRLYASFLLFHNTTSFFQPGGQFPLPWQLEVARWLAPVVISVIAVSAIVTLFAQHVTHLRISLYRDHVIVCGLGEFGQRLTRSLDDEGTRVVAIEQNPSATALQLVQERFIPLLRASATDPEQLLYAQVERARCLFAVCGDNGVNTDIGMTARACAPRRRHTLDCYLQIDDPELCQLLGKASLEVASTDATRLNYVNVLEAGPRAIMEAFPAVFDPPDGGTPTFVLLGTAPLAVQLTTEVAREWWFRGQDRARRVSQLLIAHDATEQARRLEERYPHFTQACDLRAVDMNVDVDGLDKLPRAILDGAPEGTTVFVARRSEHATLRTVLPLADELPRSVPIVALTSRSVGTTAALAEHAQSGDRSNVSNFAVLDQLCEPKAFMDSLNERLAQALHKSYLADRRRDGSFDPHKASHRDWEHLDEKFKNSNRDHAAGIFDRVDQFGYEIRPTDDWDIALMEFPPDEVEKMAVVEHDRWASSLTAAGWKFGKGFSLKRSRHFDLVPWEDLSEAERDKDREPVRELPQTLARFGFEIVRKPPSSRLRG